MKKFLEDFLDWLKFMFFLIVLTPIWCFILTYGFNVDLAKLSKNELQLLVFCPLCILIGLFCLLFGKLFGKQEENNTQKVEEPKVEEPKVEEPKVEEPKVEEPKVEEIITVTEIKGVKKIIKNGKVIYCEELKADELKVFEQLKDKKV